MQSTVEALEGNKVKVSVEIDETEFENDVNAAFRRLAKDVKVPGFRPGKAPRKALEARIGGEYARQEAIREGIPSYYVDAIKEHEIDVIGPPDIDLTEGEDAGAIKFDATVEIRPSIEVSGYESLEIEIPAPGVDEKAIDDRVEQMLGQYGTLEDVDRPAERGDRVTIDIAGTHDGEELEGLTAEDYLYEIGMGAIVPELDDNLEGASAGDELTFTAEHPDEDEEGELEFAISVKLVQATVLPVADDEWAKENTEFETVEALRADLENRMGEVATNQAISARRDNLAIKLAELVSDDDIPVALIEMETENRAQDMAMRLQAQGMDFDQFLQFTGQSREDMLLGLRDSAANSAKIDLALRAISSSEGIEVTEEQLDEEFAKVATQLDRSVESVRDEFVNAGQIPALRSDLQKSMALDWLIERCTLIDDEGNTIDPSALELPEVQESADTEQNESSPEQGDDA